MRITATEDYHDHNDITCPVLAECQRGMCQKHRLLYRFCETALVGIEGDSDVVDGTRKIVEITGDCPLCVKEHEVKALGLRMARNLP